MKFSRDDIRFLCDLLHAGMENAEMPEDMHPMDIDSLVLDRPSRLYWGFAQALNKKNRYPLELRQQQDKALVKRKKSRTLPKPKKGKIIDIEARDITPKGELARK